MKRNEKKTKKPAEPTTNPETAREQNTSAVSPTPKLPIAERVRQRASSSRQAVVNKVVTQDSE